VGVNGGDLESDGARALGARGVICRSLSRRPSNWRSQGALADELVRRGLPAISDIDTRALTRHIRDRGSISGALCTEGGDIDELIARAAGAPSMVGQALALEVSTAAAYEWSEGTWFAARSATALSPAGTHEPDSVHVVVWDFGVKHSILRCLRDLQVRVSVVPATARAAEILALRPDAVLLSNGPGDPDALPSCVAELNRLLQSAPDMPIGGICLGHQLLALAFGHKTYKLAFGHHGGNHPVRRERDGAVHITAQNHGFAVDAESVARPSSTSYTHLFDGTVAGLERSDRPVYSVQFHPEAGPGPLDARSWFDDFIDIVRRGATERRADASQPRA